MGKEQCKVDGSKTFFLKFDMHCQCNGCVKKISEGVKEIRLSEGVERADLSVETGEVKVTGRVDPEKLCRALREATKKCVNVVLVGKTNPFEETKNSFGQVPSGTEEGRAGASSSGWRNGFFPVVTPTPSAPPLPEEEEERWLRSEETVASERCWYRWSAPSGTAGVWSASDVTGTLAMYYTS